MLGFYFGASRFSSAARVQHAFIDTQTGRKRGSRYVFEVVAVEMTRRDVLIAGGLTAAVATAGCASIAEERRMYGLIGKAVTQPGQRDAFIAILMEGTSAMPGCLSYVVAKDPSDPNAVWITEVWDSEASHQASLSLPSVKAAIARGRPLIAGFGERFVTEPVGGHGLVK
jgi:quinol monooxygenase YgiN